MRYEATLAEEEALAELAELRNEYNDLDDEHDCLMEDIRNIRAAVENLIHSAENIATASGDSNIARFVHAHLDTLMENLKWGEYSKQIEEKDEEEDEDEQKGTSDRFGYYNVSFGTTRNNTCRTLRTTKRRNAV